MYVLIEFLNVTQNDVKFYFRSSRKVCDENRKIKKKNNWRLMSTKTYGRSAYDIYRMEKKRMSLGLGIRILQSVKVLLV